jgi:hypothetical protein
MSLAAIAFKKRSFRKYFDKEVNYLWFHQTIERIFPAPTMEIASLLQANLVFELIHRGEPRASKWLNETWTEDYGNYTLASAGYVGNNRSAGIESGWKYIRRDTIGSAGSNIMMRIGLNIFTPLLTKYVSNLSEKHAAKVLHPGSGIHMFPSVPSISSALWSAVQKSDATCLLLSYAEGSQAVKDAWIDFILHVFECLTPGRADAETLSVTEVIKKFHAEKRSVGFARSALIGINLPSTEFVQHLRRKYKITGSSQEEIEKLETYVQPVRVAYMDLFNRTSEWNTTYRHKDIDFCLDVMESFDSYVHSHSYNGLVCV